MYTNMYTCLHEVFNCFLLLERRRSTFLEEYNERIVKGLNTETVMVVSRLAILQRSKRQTPLE